MALLQSIRNRGKLLAIVIGLALAAFIIGDLINSGSSMFNSNSTHIASVNGKSIDYNEFNMEIYKTEDYVKLTRGLQTLDDQTTQQIRTSVWDMMIREKLLSETFDDLGIVISSAELEDMVYGNNIHPLVQQTFANPQTGQFDVTFMKTILQNLNQDPQLNAIWLYTENYIKNDKAYNKYLTLVSKGLFVNKLEVKDDNTNRTRLVNIDIVAKSVADINDADVSFTEQEVVTYYNDHKTIYQNTEESRDIAYISFDVIPSQQDTIDTYEKAIDDVQYFAVYDTSTIDFQHYSETTLATIGLDSSVFGMPVDTVLGPYLFYGSYQLARIVSFYNRPDTVSARHILISPQNPRIGSIQRAQQVSDSLVTVIKNGGDFAQLVTLYSDDQGSLSTGGLYENFTDQEMVAEFSDFCFTNPVGKLGTVVTQYGVHIIEVTDRKDVNKVVNVAVSNYTINASSETFNKMYQYVTALKGQIFSAEDFEKAIVDSNYVRKEATDITQGTNSIPGIQSVRDVVQWAFESDVDELSQVFSMPDQYVIAVLTNKNEIGYLNLEKVRPQVEGSVLMQKKVEKIYNDYFANVNTSDLNALSANLGVQKMSVPNVSFSAFQLSSYGYEPAVLAAVLKMDADQTIGPIKGVNGVYVIKATSVTGPNELTADDIVMQKQRLKTALQSRANYQLFTALKAAAHIDDRRYKFF
ncbi:MAG: SurA N-terminal domain-containing protein [Bacteroidales bacterium]|nr:SurA N-terminal domain-containing protein [Bacteroidales bacterium]